MPIKHIFVSHAGEDVDIATRLVENLRNIGHDVKVDTTDLNLGDGAIDYMNKAIADAHTVVILYSAASHRAKWQRLEIDAATWNEVEQEGGRCVLVRLDGTPVPPLLGPKVYGTLDANDTKSFRTLVHQIAKVTQNEASASSTVASALGAESTNPFRRLRAEFFEDRPDLHAKTFASPGGSTKVLFEDMKPSFLEGSRGTGKSMLLLSLRLRNVLARFPGKAPEYFGFYVKLTRGALCNIGATSRGDLDPQIDPLQAAQIYDLAEQELIIQAVESLISELIVTARILPGVDTGSLRDLAEVMVPVLFGSTQGGVRSLDSVLTKLADIHAQIAEFARRKFIYGEHPTVPAVRFDLDLLRRVVDLVKKVVESFSATKFVLLLDEYENLFPYQQRIVNGFVKFGPPVLSLKIAKKVGVGDVSGTTVGQDLQEIHDYSRIPLVYDVEDADQRSAYFELLRHFVSNVIDGTQYTFTSVDELLPEATEDEVDRAALLEKVRDLLRLSSDQFESLSADEQREKITYYAEAATYRVLLSKRGRHAAKRFAGFSQLALLSSGVIRYFQEILGVGFHLADTSSAALVIPADKQTKAVHLVSQHNLTTLSRNVERYGEDLKYFLLDLGDCLREKLLKHSSEPEAARLTIADPERLNGIEMEPLRRLLAVGEREGVFQTKEGRPAFRPKHGSDPQPVEFNVCRIYAPVLQISPRLRWRTRVDCLDLLGLAVPGSRAATVRELKKKFVKVQRDPNVGLLREDQ
jgi:hypothetical protein